MRIENAMYWIFPKSWIKPNSVEQTMSPITMSCWFFGMGIIEIPFGKRWPVASFFYALVLTLVYSFLAVTFIKDNNAMIPSPHIVCQQAIIYGNICLNIFGTLFGWMRTKDVKNIIVRLEKSDGKMEKLGIQRNYELNHRRQIISLVIQFFLVLAFVILSYDEKFSNFAKDWKKLAGQVTIYYPIIVATIGDFSFLAMVRFITLRFNELNKYLLTMSTTTEDSPQHKRVLDYSVSKIHDIDDFNDVLEKRTRDDSNVIRAARSYHHELVKIAQIISDTFGKQAFLSISVSFVLIIVLLCPIIMAIVETVEGGDIFGYHLTSIVFWLAIYIYKIIVINLTCARASVAAKKTCKIICHLHEPSTRKEYRDGIHDFALQMMHHSLTFTACGFFELNHQLLQTIIGSVTTYMVILVQSEMVPPSVDRNITESSL